MALLLAAGAHMASAQSFGLAPAQVPYTFKPGQPFEVDLGVSNGGGQPATMRAMVTDLWYNDKNEKTFGTAGSTPRSAANWIEVAPSEITVPANGAGTIKVMGTPPLQASGGYYAAVFVESRPELIAAATDEKGAVFSNIRLGSLILLSAENTEDYSIDVFDPELKPPGPSQPLKIEFGLTNKSNTHIFPQTRLAILDSDGHLVAKTEAETKRFFPGQTDRISASWAGDLPPGGYTALLTVAYGTKIYSTDVPFRVRGNEVLVDAFSPVHSQ